jgi:uncharacterized protein (TIGR02001 family)
MQLPCELNLPTRVAVPVPIESVVPPRGRGRGARLFAAPRLFAAALLGCMALVGGRECAAGALGGELAAASDYIFRGISQGNGDPAAQADLHYTTGDGTFVGAFGSTLERLHGHGYLGELDAYLGHRFDLNGEWAATVSGTGYWYLGSNLPTSNNYQELALSLSWLDRWSLGVAASPNWPAYEGRYRLGRYTSYVASIAGQMPLWGHFFATAGIGYSSLTGPEGSRYAYGNGGVAFQYDRWRIDAGYFVTQKRAEALFPYGRALNRVAATLSWHF